MATFKLGAIITDVQGSISGTTLRRTTTGHSMYNKQGSQIKSAFAQASRKNALANIFRAWGELDKATQETWAENALLYQVPDKFGKLKNLTGRQLFTKLNSQLLPTGTTSNVATFDTYVESKDASLVNFSLGGEVCAIGFPLSSTEQKILVSVYRVRRKGGVKPHAHFKRTAVERTKNQNNVDIWDSFINQFPLAVAGQEYGFNIQYINESGVTSSVLAFTGTLAV